MSAVSNEVLEARVSLIERRMQLISDELSAALSRLAPPESDAATEPEFPSQLNFDADAVSQFSQGFYEREYDAAGKVFRWTGSGPLCELRFFVNREHDRQFAMSVGETPAQVLSELTGFIDYAPVPLAIERDGKTRRVIGIIPKRSYTRLAVVTFLLGKVVPKKKAEPVEISWLGFQFYSLGVG